MSKKSTTLSAGARKAVKKAEKIGGKLKPSGNGQTVVSTEHYTDKGTTVPKAVVEGQADSTGEIRTFPIKGKLSKFKQNMGKAESRAAAFIKASSEGKLFEGR